MLICLNLHLYHREHNKLRKYIGNSCLLIFLFTLIVRWIHFSIIVHNIKYELWRMNRLYFLLIQLHNCNAHFKSINNPNPKTRVKKLFLWNRNEAWKINCNTIDVILLAHDWFAKIKVFFFSFFKHLSVFTETFVNECFRTWLENC